MSDPAGDSCRYRITLAPVGGRGTFRAQAIIEIAMAEILAGGELRCVQFQAAKAAESLLGRSASALEVVKAERQVNGIWHDRRWPVYAARSMAELEFRPDGTCVTNVVPTWPR